MRELWVYQILEEDAIFCEWMRDIWVFQILEEDAASILLPLARKFVDTVPVAGLVL